MDTARPDSFIEFSAVKFRIWPIVLAGLIIEPLLMLGREPARWLWKHGPVQWADHRWIFVGLACLLQGVVGVLAIFAMRRVLPAAEDHLRWPSGRSYAGLAFAIGFGMAVVMFFADYPVELIRHTPPHAYATTPLDAVGWIIAVAMAPLGEETIFRGFLIGGLAVLVPGRLRIGKFDLPLAAYIVAVLFAVVHWRSFIVSPLHLAIAQQSYAIAWGLIYAWLMERSNSLLAPVIAHATSDAFEVAFVILWRIFAS